MWLPESAKVEKFEEKIKMFIFQKNIIQCIKITKFGIILHKNFT
jgi:hypothetical protein